MDTEKKPEEPTTERPKQDIGQLVGDLVVSGVTVLANTAAQAVVNRVKKRAAKSPRVKAVTKAGKKPKKSIAKSKTAKSNKAKKTPKTSGAKNAGKRASRKSAKKSTKKKSAKKSKR